MRREITGAEFSVSEHHTAGGISIRFPRVTRIRKDKTPQQATSLGMAHARAVCCEDMLTALPEELQELVQAAKEVDTSLLNASSDSGQQLQRTLSSFFKPSSSAESASAAASTAAAKQKRHAAASSEEEKAPKRQKIEKQANAMAAEPMGTAAAPAPSSASAAATAESKVRQKSSDDKRPSCTYGITCYRKNPQHFRQFWHPHRDDEGKPISVLVPDPAAAKISKPELPRRPPCEYGAHCTRTQPRHFDVFAHPSDPDYVPISAQPQASSSRSHQRQRNATSAVNADLQQLSGSESEEEIASESENESESENSDIGMPASEQESSDDESDSDDDIHANNKQRHPLHGRNGPDRSSNSVKLSRFKPGCGWASSSDGE